MSDPPSDPEIDPQLPAPVVPAERLLTAAEFHRLADVPPEIEWFANIRNRQHPARLRERDRRFHAVRRHRPARRNSAP